MCPVWCICFDRHKLLQGDLTKHCSHGLLCHINHTTDTDLKDSEPGGYSPDLRGKKGNKKRIFCYPLSLRGGGQ